MNSSSSEVSETSIMDSDSDSDSESKTSESDTSLDCSSFFFALPFFLQLLNPLQLNDDCAYPDSTGSFYNIRTPIWHAIIFLLLLKNIKNEVSFILNAHLGN